MSPRCAEHDVELVRHDGRQLVGYAEGFAPTGWYCPADPGHPVQPLSPAEQVAVTVAARRLLRGDTIGAVQILDAVHQRAAFRQAGSGTVTITSGPIGTVGGAGGSGSPVMGSTAGGGGGYSSSSPARPPRDVIAESVDYVNTHLVGKTIAAAEQVDTGCPVQSMRLVFTDGTSVTIESEHDEGWVFQ